MSRSPAPYLAFAAVVAVWLLPFQAFSLWTDAGFTDLPVYQRIADGIAAGGVPYRDVEIEYPPLATAIFWVADHFPGDYAAAFGALMMVSLGLTAAGVAATADALGLSAARRLAAIAAVALSPLLLGNLIETRFDLALAAVLAWVLFAAVTGRWRLMWFLLAAGILLKLMPLALLPVLVLWHAHRVDLRAALTGAVAAVAGALAVVVPFAVLSPSGTWNMVGYHLERPPQIESMPSTYMLVLHWLADIPLSVESSFGSQGLPADGPAIVASVGTALMIGLVGAIAISMAMALRRARAGLDARLVVAGVAATIAALLATGKVLSPQFIVWLLPATFLVAGRYGRWAGLAGVAAMVGTQLYFPRRYLDLVALQDTPIMLLAARNAVLIALVALCWPRSAMAAPPPPSPLMSRAPGAPEVSGPDHAVKARYLAG